MAHPSGRPPSGPARGTSSVWQTGYAMLTYALMGVAIGLVFLYVPTEKVQGIVQRIFYFHVASAITTTLAGLVVFVASVMYLAKPAPWWDHVAASAVEIGTLFCTLVLLTGPIWARPIWGVWWTWDPTLTLTLVLWLVYVAYLMLRTNVLDEHKRARFSAVLGIVGGVDVFFIHWSVRKWRTLHPKPVVIQEGMTTGLPESMMLTFVVCLAAFVLLFFLLLRQRMQLTQSRHQLEALRDRIEHELSS